MRRAARITVAALLPVSLAGSLPGEAEAQSWRTVTMSRQWAGEETLDVRVSYGMGQLRIRPAEGGLLYHMQLRYDEETFEPRAEYRSGRLELGVEGVGRNIRLGRDRDRGELDLRLARDVAMDLRLEFGAVRADIELGGLALTALDLETGASETRIRISEPNPVSMARAELEVGAADFDARHLGNLNARRIDVSCGVGNVTLDFSGQWSQDATVDLEIGLGAATLRFPEGLGVRLEKSGFLLSVNAQGMVKRGDAYYSPDWDEADRRVTVFVDGALGSVSVEWVR